MGAVVHNKLTSDTGPVQQQQQQQMRQTQTDDFEPGRGEETNSTLTGTFAG